MLQLRSEGLRLLHTLHVLHVRPLAHASDEGAKGQIWGGLQRQELPGELYEAEGDVDEKEDPGEEGEDTGEGEDKGGTFLEEEVGGGEKASHARSYDSYNAEHEEARAHRREGEVKEDKRREQRYTLEADWSYKHNAHGMRVETKKRRPRNAYSQKGNIPLAAQEESIS